MSTKQTAINDALRVSAAAAARARSEAIAQKVRDTMRLIDEEIEANDGLYPAVNLSQRELCRRAGVHYQTLQQPIHKESLKLAVDSWLASKKKKTVRDTRKAVTDLAAHWKEQHQKVATQICIYEAELAERNMRIAELEELRARLQEQNTILRKSKIRPLLSIDYGDKG
jgi:transcriptional regulator with XRE-family HTH domain